MKMMFVFMGGISYKYIIYVLKKVKKINVLGVVIKGNMVIFFVLVIQFGEE